MRSMKRLSSWLGSTCIALLSTAATTASAATLLEPQLQIAAEERYDDGFLFAADGLGAAGQLMTKVTPTLGLELSSRTLEGEATYSTDLLVRHGSGNVTFDHRADLALRQEFSPRTAADLQLRLWRVTDPTSLPRMGLARSFDPVLYGRADVGASHHLGRRWIGRLSYRFEGARIFTADETDRPTGLYHAPAADLWFRASPRFDVGAGYRLQLFSHSEEDAGAHNAYGQLRWRIDRQTALTVTGGPGLFWREGAEGTELFPRFSMELAREADRLELGFALGHDLVGASGFESALWADYVSGSAGWRFSRALSVFGGVSYYRNGLAPNDRFNPFGGEPTAHGFGAGGGVDWSLNRRMSMQVALQRIVQIGGYDGITSEGIERNIASVRLRVTAW